MKIEIRSDNKVIIDGYVNAVERRSRPFVHRLLGKIVEIVTPNAFKRAIDNSKNIDVLLNHDENRKLADTASGTAKLVEDNVGLRATVEISDPEVVDKARKGKLRGWSFGFTDADDELRATDDDTQERRLKDFVLHEVSIIDDRAMPAYFGTSIETRSIGDQQLEIRTTTDDTEIETTDKTALGGEENPDTKNEDTTKRDSTKADEQRADEEAQKAEIEQQALARERDIREASI